MTKTCPSCGAVATSETRFCRKCGTPLSGAASVNSPDAVSPLAATIPLTSEGRTTDGFNSSDEPWVNSPETTRVNRADLDAIMNPKQVEPPSPPPPSRSDLNAAVAQYEPPTDFDELPPLPPSDDLKATTAFTIPPFDDQTSHRASYRERADKRTGEVRDRPDSTPLGEPNVGDEDDDLTVAAPRPGPPSTTASEIHQSTPSTAPTRTLPPTTKPAPEGHTVAPSPPMYERRRAPTAAANTVAPPPAAGTVTESRAQKVWLVLAAVGLVLIIATATGAWFVVRYFSPPDEVVNDGQRPPIPVSSNPLQMFDEKLAEAEAQLASGDLDSAIESLREANRLDPANTKAHWRLGDVLRDNNRRREAIDEYRAVTRNDPNDRAAWRTLGSALLAEGEGFYAEAANAYRKLLDLIEESDQDPNDRLAYADALLHAGQETEARALYQELSTSSVPEVASLARQRLSGSDAQPTPTGSVIPQPTPLARSGEGRGATGNVMPEVSTLETPVTPPAPTVAATPTPAPTPAPSATLSPAERYQRGVELWSSNRAAALTDMNAAASAGNPDAHYYLGLNMAGERDPRTLKRAELLTALRHFQIAKGGRFRAQAQRYEDSLGKEYDRIRAGPRQQ
ncbi:MAG: tetratricopeptide repeat protein [Acidobacteriota bacterium]|nr:tetratricopeptide repeat protein [Acidobacteriota bacterium]